ncbi:hypothetical protein JIN77_01850 [Verrucomicrobiaceae bacterium R5-34]|uniref:Uncharacterized protein n=1 Tax=Oceaniferula flava TaxID=2800421 RepID=A0AAE2VAS7_9BACT|nr:hypothetical protein [Oceaniferula flavus]MBK1829454.1 hypothetical protein [Verrucomicrobiaceae bacterium R5-34]MBK1853680.1 hypothetical protein [Oceaniferula flavus]MBM1134986.1 hypothetical protein [Oceaniferula flavus]
MSQPNILDRCLKNCTSSFHQQHAILWPAVSRTANLLAVLNVSLFFLNGSVKSGGYYFPLLSLSLLALAVLLVLLPLGQHDRLWYYLVVLTLCGIAAWLLGSSILYWLQSNA